MVMPEMDGFAVMEKLQNTKEYEEIPIIFLTGDLDRETEIEVLRKGAMDFITKPFVAEIMLQRVSRILELCRLQKNLQEEVRIQTKEAQEQRRQVELLSEEVMKTLANTIDAKDKYTNGHSVRVATYSREIAKRCGKSWSNVPVSEEYTQICNIFSVDKETQSGIIATSLLRF